MPFLLGFETPKFIRSENPTKNQISKNIPTGFSIPGLGVNDIFLPPDLPFLPEGKIVEKNKKKKSKSGQRIIRTDLTDFTSITSVKTVRKKITLPEGQIAEVGTDDDEAYELSVNFLVDLNALNTFRKNSKNQKVDLCGISLISSGKNNLSVIKNKGFLISRILRDEKAIRASKEVANKNKNPLYPVQITFDLKKSELDAVEDLNLSFLFSFFEKGQKNKSVIKDLEFAVPYDLKKDLKVFFTVKNPVKISASTLTFSKTLLTIEKPSNCNAKGVNIFRRKLVGLNLPSKKQEPFRFLTSVDFESQTNTKLDEAYQTIIIVGDDNEDNKKRFNLPHIDNSFGYVYRAIPVGYENAPAIVFDDSITRPMGQGSFETGSDFRVFPIPESGKNASNGSSIPLVTSKITGYAFKDSNFLGVDAPAISIENKIGVCSYSSKEGIVVILGNVSNQGIITVLRKDITAGDKKFSIVKIEDSKDKETITLIDENVIDSHAYEYAIKTTSVGGVCSYSQDRSTTIFRDEKLLSNFGINLRTEVQEASSSAVKIKIDVSLPQNMLSLIAALLGGRNESDVFLKDIIRGRKDLTPQISLVLTRMNISTGQEVSFKMSESPGNFKTAKTESKDQKDEDKLPNVSSFIFTDNNISAGSKYKYEVRVNLREPLSLTDELTPVIRAGSEPYIYQSCKNSNPLFLNKGILPPTQKEEDFIKQKNIQNGKLRLLNLFTPEDEFDLGATKIKTIIPFSGFMRIPSSEDTKLKIQNHRFVREKVSELSWIVKGNEHINYYEVLSEDTFINFTNKRKFIKTSYVASVAAQSEDNSKTFTMEDSLDRLDNDDISDFNSFSNMNIMSLQDDIDSLKVDIKRRYIVNAIGFDESVVKSIKTDSVVILNNRIRKAKRGIKFVFNPGNLNSKSKKVEKIKRRKREGKRAENNIKFLARAGNEIATRQKNIIGSNINAFSKGRQEINESSASTFQLPKNRNFSKSTNAFIRKQGVKKVQKISRVKKIFNLSPFSF